MVLLRELDGAKDYPLVIHHVGSDWERQVRAHYTRADGTLNINGYYPEMFGFTVKSSDFESETSDSDSSGDDSDCIIISSSEFSSRNPNNRSLIVADYVATIFTSMEISSRFTTADFISTFRQAVHVSGEGGENRVVIDPVAVGEFVTTVNGQEPHYFYMYTHVIQTLNLWLPFNSFECQILRVMNIAPCQLHPNSLAFLKAFQIACECQPNKGRFSLYASNFKNYRDTFVRFRCREGFPELMFDASGNHLFPFYWLSAPRLIKGTRADTLNEYERQAVAAFNRFHVMSSSELLARENKTESLGEYLSSMSTLSAQQRAALVLKARAQRAEAERAAASTDDMSQLVVEESGVKNNKRKNSEETGRIPVEIPKKRKSTVVDEEEAEIEDEPLKFRRTSKASSQCCPSNPEAKKGKKSNLSASLFTKDFDSFGMVDDGFQKFVRTYHLSELTFEDLKQAAMDHHIQGVLLTYYLSNRQELEYIDFRNKMESADTSLSALEKEFVAAKSKFDEDLAAVKAEQEQKVKAAVKAKDDEVIALKGKVKALEGELEVKVVFPDVDAVKLGELDSVNQIVDGKIVVYVPPASE
ncbi:hypothetical protein TSUD_348860 [Trifolium subterraneum]|uniref:Uncharacterized protein n=1 Tax=Trifolium subterraneum TaxID=3900 RepID=A0A2Z6P9M1_TRISU|nr:hypothetical protein TSUD_348860 [Trifolium subterraneum]